MLKQTIGSVSAAVLLAVAGTAGAATKTDTMQVSATVSKNCVITAAPLNLGTFDGTNNLTASADINVRCTTGTTFGVALNTGSSGSYANRTLVNGTDTLAYNLYTTNAYTTVWGDGTGTTGTRTGTGTGMAAANAQALTVYGRLLASANTGAVNSGTYTDTITATITY
ncbi:MAG: spore coat protein U domain-containing protein [Steroidobacteraceae bacterium]